MPLSHYLQSTNPDFKNKAENAGEVQWRPGTEHFAPVMLEMPNAWGCAIFLDSCWQHCSSPAEITSWFWCLAGILKFHEYYLGDSLTENAGDFHEANSVALQTLTTSALEQHISSVREALGVDSYYTRWAGIWHPALCSPIWIYNILGWASWPRSLRTESHRRAKFLVQQYKKKALFL